MDYYLQGFGPDGACLEGLGYWNYGFGYFVYYADLLRKRTRGEMDWFRAEKVGRIALFQQRAFGRQGRRQLLRFATGKQGAHRLVSLSGRIVRRLRVSAAVSGRLTATTIAAAGLRPCAT